MVSGKTITHMILGIVARIFILVLSVVLGFFTSAPAHEFNTAFFDFQRPNGFFGFTLADWELAMALSTTFWSGLIFGAIGKRIDYIFIGLTWAFTLWMYATTENVTPAMYGGLAAVALGGLGIGYLLKVLRTKMSTKTV